MQGYFLQDSNFGDAAYQTVNRIMAELSPEMPHWDFITDMAFIMIVGAVVTLAFFKINQPIIIGYLFAGMLLGPISPLWTWIFQEFNLKWSLPGGASILGDITALHLFAEIGIILLLFVIGIEFPYRKIRSIGGVAIGAGSIGLFSALGVVFYAASAMGMSFMDSLFIAAALSISSTAVIVKILEDMGRIENRSSLMILGILIVEDVIAVILISTLQSVALAGTISVEGLIVVVMVGAGLIGGTFTIGMRIIPPLIDRVASTEHREILLLSLLGLCFGYALLANLVGLSVAIGAFLAGVLVAESKSANVSKILTRPIKDMFVGIFFISTGALMDLSQLGDYMWLAVALIGVATFMKFGGSIVGNLLFKQKRLFSLRVSTALAAPRGEFSIVIVKAGVDLGAASAFLFPLIGVISIITTFMTPFVMKAGEKVISNRAVEAENE
ncbi:MAG: cation:proton antiporter [Cenarchaeum sp. SB0661_bin_35]|nr:cation:proton antiporter [Cenarchaeum sp. SB0667_bin_13]MXZ93531.1 cation:proton antiporter [Cenarchaeum sp. SB0666_bin_15]MYB46599.1 cation:proton antiporter [Cenarchaeum sp. SB0662_bin_33]MYC79875.1 cation:proton antiporter [Cenarchaeum sp. SB0661_bin_35]MYD58768.1 cation:proton antiporter [Cenarchaeum sp. SB0678_bin_8]MYI51842.1 cation:proton antiporter [Cenarchaeum sp. SB0673_bin_9]MYJ27216.1 cation:proton antiporter [Cenarchaeum sp. SB0672_bin_9]